MPKIITKGIEFENGMTVLKLRISWGKNSKILLRTFIDSCNCRMCLVEMDKSKKPIASCAMPATEGMNIKTNTKMVEAARKV